MHRQTPFITHSLILGPAFHRSGFLRLRMTTGGRGVSRCPSVLTSLGVAVHPRAGSILCSQGPRRAPQEAAASVLSCSTQIHFGCSPGSHIQVLVKSTTFLFLISVAMFFPGLPSPILRAHSSCSHHATPRLITHHGLDSLGQGSHILLMEKRFVNYILNLFCLLISTWLHFYFIAICSVLQEPLMLMLKHHRVSSRGG